MTGLQRLRSELSPRLRALLLAAFLMGACITGLGAAQSATSAIEAKVSWWIGVLSFVGSTLSGIIVASVMIGSARRRIEQLEASHGTRASQESVDAVKEQFEQLQRDVREVRTLLLEVLREGRGRLT